MSLVTYRGTVFDYKNPTPEMIHIDDILRSIVRLNRFVGHSSRAYNVGEHSFYCLVMAELLGYTAREQLLTFIHDFTEPYCADLPAPLKKLLPEYQVYEAKIEEVIYQAFGIEPPTPEEQIKIKRIDLTMLVIEMRDLTVHEWESFINENTYVEMLDHEELKLSDDDVLSEQSLRELLSDLFEIQMEKVKEEEANA